MPCTPVVVACVMFWGFVAGNHAATQRALTEVPRQEKDRCGGFKMGTFSTIEIGKPVRLREVMGRVELDLGGRGEAQFIPDVLFQVCGAATKYEIIVANSNADGRFRMTLVPGRYTFVAAKDGFQSVKGFLLVSRWSFRRSIRVRLPLGL